MSITSSELICYGSASRPTADTGTVGGAIDAVNRPVFTQMTANSALEVVSSSASDTTQVVTVTGRDATGAFVTCTATLNGTTAVALAPTTTFQRILSCSLSANGVGTVTLRNTSAGTTWGTVPIGERGFYSMFTNAVSGASSTVRYEKLFWKNTDSTLSLTSSTVTLTADPSSITQIGLPSTINDSGTATNRVTAPSSVTFVGVGVAQSVPNSGSLTAGSGIGVWVSQTLAINAAPLQSTFTTQLAGNTV
jgi:hypothetical protein